MTVDHPAEHAHEPGRHGDHGGGDHGGHSGGDLGGGDDHGSEHGHDHGHDHGADHRPRVVERVADVVVLGGTAGGLGVAVGLAERELSVIVVAPSSPDDLAAARARARSHGVEVLAGRAEQAEVSMSATDDRPLRVSLLGGHAIATRRVVVASDSAGDSDREAVGLGGTTPGTEAIDPRLVVASADPEAVETVVAAAHADLARLEDLDNPFHSTLRRDWDNRYAGRPMWSGNPNGALVAEVADLPPGRALDVGAGEGGDAVWLAERGWTVTANDISGAALQRLEREAGERGLHVALLWGDANTPGVFGEDAFDLVSAMYASIPRRVDGRGVANLLGAVAVGGTLLVVSHDLAPMRAPIDTTTSSRAFDPDAYVRVEDVADAVAADPSWTIEVHGLRPRPPGSATAHVHVDDLILRARRLA